MADDLTPSQQAAAFHGLATNIRLQPGERMSCALQALDLYEAEVERLNDRIDSCLNTLDLIETACDTATGDTIRDGIRSMIRRARIDATTEGTPNA